MNTCASCKADIVWLRTERGHMMPVNAESVRAGDVVFKPGVHISHFATCKFADQHRKPRGSESGKD